MALKMRELVKLTNTPKSTILYYIKEGLLPEPKKPKPNVHLYDESYIEKIKFIKYIQKHFNASIEQLKQLMQNEKFSLNEGYKSILNTLELLMSPPKPKRYSKDEICKLLKLEPDEIDEYLKEGLIFKRDGGFSQKEIEILEILKGLKEIDSNLNLAKLYSQYAKATSEAEIDLISHLFKRDELDNKSLKALFDAVLILKPYIFNMQLFQTYQESIKGAKDERVTK